MSNILIIHGTYGSPEGNWFPRLKTELEQVGHQAFIPNFPTPENQSLESRLKVFEEYKKYFNQDTILIGHSLWSPFLLSILEILEQPVKACFLISGFTGLLGNSEFDELNKTFTTKEFNRAKIKEKCEKFVVINSDNDPYVPLEKGKILAKNLGTELTILHKAGHINKESGYTEFNFLLEKIKEIL